MGAGQTNLIRLDVSQADGLTVDGVIVPQAIEVSFGMKANGSLSTQAFFLANADYEVTAISEVHSTAGSDSGAVTISVSKDSGTSAPGAGTGLLSAAFNAKGTANTVQDGALSATESDLVLAPGDRLSVVFAGTLTALAGVLVTVSLQRSS
jgi:hypothetical protein